MAGSGATSRPRKAGRPTVADDRRPPLWSRPGYLIRRVHQMHTALFAEECRRWGITPVQYGVLTALQHRPGIDQASIGAEVGIDRTNAADVLERLAERGLVQRDRSLTDRRMMLAALTPAGATLTRDMHAAMQRAQARLLEPLRPADRKRLMQLLVALVESEAGKPPASRPARRPRARRD